MRKTVPSLRDTTEKKFIELLPVEFERMCTTTRAGGHINTLTFPNGSIYYFRGLDDWKKLRSLNLAFIIWDESDEFTPDDFLGMQSRLRQVDPTPMAKRQGAGRITRNGNVLAANPQGRNWLWEQFVGPKRKEGTEYWTSSSLDNPFLPLSYIEDLLSYPSPWVRRYVLCSFDEFGGAIYEDWTYATHVIQPYKDLKGRYNYDPSGFFLMGFDPGTFAGNAALWVYYDKEKHQLVGVAEYNETGLAASAHADAWRRIEATHGMRVRNRIADPVINTRDRGSNMTLLDQYRRLGYHFSQGPRSVSDRLWALGSLIPKRRFVVTSDCMQTFEQIQQYRYGDLTPAQVERGTDAKPKKNNVDLVDAAQYVAGLYIAPPSNRSAANRTDAEQYQFEVKRAIRETLGDRAGGGSALNHDLGTMSL